MSSNPPAPTLVIDRWRHPDGTELTIRSIRADDLAREEAFLRHLSPQSAYQRMMSVRFPTPQELRRFTDIDPRHEIALVITRQHEGQEEQIAVARCIDLDDHGRPTGEAEFAIVIADEWQSRGLGMRLMTRLIEAARAHGVRRLVGYTLSDNTGMLRLARSLGFELSRQPGEASVTGLVLELSEASERPRQSPTA